MLRYLYADQLAAHPLLARTMFRDRARQFSERLGWEVRVDEGGLERDQYDLLNPLYVIWETPEGQHGGSMRFLPTTGETMVNDHFLHLTDGVSIRSPRIWECTRFCLATGAGTSVAAALMAGGGEILRGLGLTHFVGVFDSRMTRIYRRIGAEPEILGTDAGGTGISVGLWSFSAEARARVLDRACLRPETSTLWFNRAFGIRSPARLTVAASD